jgi:NAD(P)H-flavin reductase
MHDVVRVGYRLEMSGPHGGFIFTGAEAQRIVLIGGGVGVTPLMSVRCYLNDVSWQGQIHFLYSVTTPQDVIFARMPSLNNRVTLSYARAFVPVSLDYRLERYTESSFHGVGDSQVNERKLESQLIYSYPLNEHGTAMPAVCITPTTPSRVITPPQKGGKK